MPLPIGAGNGPATPEVRSMCNVYSIITNRASICNWGTFRVWQALFRVSRNFRPSAAIGR
jgi:hypothetical protein